MAELPNPNASGAATASKEDMMQVSFLKDNKGLLQSINDSISLLNKNFVGFIDQWKDALAAAERARLEALLEAKRGMKTSGNTKKSKMEIPEGLSMGVLSWAAIAGLVASITDIDDYINAAKLPGRFNSVRKAIGVVGTFLGDFGTKIKDTFKLPKKLSTTMTADLIGDWFKEATKGIKNVLKLDSPGFVKFIDDVKLGGTGMLDELTVGAGKVVTSVKSMLKFDSPGFVKFADDVNIKGTGILDDLTVGANKVKGVFKTLVSPITTLIENAKLSGASVADDVTKGIANVKGMFTSIKSFFTTIFKPIEDLKAALTLDLEGGVIMKALRGVGEFFKPLKTFFSSMWDILKPAKAILGAAKAIPIVGQVIGIVMGIFDFFTGFIDGFSEKESTFDEDGNEMKDQRTILEKTMDGVQQGLFNLFREMIFIPLDLIKSGVSWVMGKLGFPGAEKAMDKFSFTKLFDDFFEKGTTFSDIVRKLVTLPYQGVMWIWGKLLGFLGFKDAEKWLTGFKFDDLVKEAGIDPETGKFSFTTLISNFIESIGEWFDTMIEDAMKIIRKIPGFGDLGKTEAQVSDEALDEEREAIQNQIDKRKRGIKQTLRGRDLETDTFNSADKKSIERTQKAIEKLEAKLAALDPKAITEMGKMAAKAQDEGSIYVHDISVENALGKTTDSLEKTAEISIGSAANSNSPVVVAGAPVSTGGGGAAPQMSGGGDTNTVVNNAKTVNHAGPLRDRTAPETFYMKRFGAM